MPDCLFCNIIQGNLPADFVFQDDFLVAFKDIQPKANVHVLVVPKVHIKSLAEVTEQHHHLLSHITLCLHKIAHSQGLTSGFRTIVNTGQGGGQEIDHLHYHILGGKLPTF